MSNAVDACKAQAEELVAKAQKAGADAADALMVQATDVEVSCRNGKPEDMQRAESAGIGLRVFVGKQVASVSSSDVQPEALQELVERAVAMAKAATEDEYAALAPKDRLATQLRALDLEDAAERSTETLLADCMKAEEAALEREGITNSEGAEASASRYEMALATSDGFAQNYATTQHSLSVCVLAGEGTGMERDYDYSMARFAADLKAPEAIGAQAADYTLRRMNPRKVETQQVPVVFAPRVARSLLNSFTGAISGSAVARGTSFLKGKMGEKLFADNVRIIDDPHRLRGLASKPYDAEGVANTKSVLVDSGELQQWLLDVRSANQLGLQTTGHASRGLGSAPHPSSSNCYMEAGEASPDALIADIAAGFYVTDVFGMGVNMVTGDYSQGASGLWIEKGELSYAVSELTIASTLPEMFASLVPANDLRFDYATNAPTLMVPKMTVAGN